MGVLVLFIHKLVHMEDVVIKEDLEAGRMAHGAKVLAMKSNLILIPERMQRLKEKSHLQQLGLKPPFASWH